MKNQIKITEEQAKKLLETNEELSDEIFNAFPQLKPKPIVFKSWEDIGIIRGHFLDTSSKLCYITGFTASYKNKNVFATEKQCLSMLAYAQLTQLMKATDDCEVDWTDENTKYCICFGFRNNNFEIRLTSALNIFEFLAFNTQEIAEEFKDTHIDLIKQFFQL